MVTLRAARTTDAATIVDTFRAAIPDSVSAVHILGAPKAVAYVHDSVIATGSGGDSEYWVAEQGDGKMAGFVQIRRSHGITVIDNLHVTPASQDRGIGTELLRLALDSSMTDRIGIDVFQISDVAMALYRKLGFAQTHSRHWRWFEPVRREPHDFYLHNLPQAQAVHAAYSISMLQIETPDGMYEVGRIGDRWFRVMSSRALEDDALGYAFWRVDPKRSTLAVLSSDDDQQAQPPDLISHRMEGSAADLRVAIAR